MSLLKLDLDKETAKELRAVILRPFILSLLIGLGSSLIITAVAAAILGSKFTDQRYSFSLDHSDGWIIFTIFITMTIAISVVAYYKLREEHQKLVEDVLTPFRKELVGEWRVYWTDKFYTNEGGQPKLEDHTENDSCQFGIDNVGKLYIDSELHHHELLEDWKKRIEDISINLSQNRVTFFDQGRFAIRREKMKNPDEEREFDAKFFVYLGVDKIDEQKRVTKFEGRWYDLDGTFAKFKETLSRQIHPDLPKEIHFPRSGPVAYEKAPRRDNAS